MRAPAFVLLFHLVSVAAFSATCPAAVFRTSRAPSVPVVLSVSVGKAKECVVEAENAAEIEACKEEFEEECIVAAENVSIPVSAPYHPGDARAWLTVRRVGRFAGVRPCTMPLDRCFLFDELLLANAAPCHPQGSCRGIAALAAL